MAGTVSNILFGTCTLSVNGVDVGYTTGGVQVSKKIEQTKVEADQVAGYVKIANNFETMQVMSRLLESTLANLLVAMAEPSSNTSGSGDLLFGSSDPVANEYIITLTGNGPGGTTRTYTFYRAVISEGSSQNIGKRGEVQDLPVTWELLKDTNGNFGHYADA